MKLSRRYRAAACAALLSSAPAAAQTASIGANFVTATSSESSLNPPDTNGAVGPNHVVIHNNGRYKMFNKAGTLAAGTSQTGDNFWSSRVGLTVGFAFDPRVVYDRQSGRWFATSNDGANTVNSFTLIGVSAGTDPTAAGWFGVRQRMDASADPRWADFNQLAVGPNWVAVTNNMFDVSNVGTNLSTNVSLITIPKASLVAGNATGLSYQANLSANSYGFTPHPATDHFAQSNTQYTLSNYGTGLLQLSTITGTVNSPTYADLNLMTVNNNSSPPDAGQQGTATLVATNDDRIGSQPVLVDGKLWAVQNGSSGGLASIRWLRLNPVTNVREAEGYLPVPAGLHIYFPSIAVNRQGDIVIGYSGSASTGTPSFPSTYYTVGRYNSGTNTTTFGQPVQTFAGTSAITGGRFGDYSATNLDPTDPGIFWTFQEYGQGTNSWATRATEVIPTRAGEVRLRGPTGTLGTGTNWFNDTAPVATDHAIFSRWQTAAVTVTGGATTYDRLSVRQTGTGTVTINLSGAALTLTNTGTATPSLAVAEFQGDAALTVTNTVLSTQTTIVAGEQFGTGTLTLGTGTTWTNAGGVFVGGTATAAGGTGTLALTGTAAGTVTGTLTVWNTASAVTVAATASLSVGALASPAGVSPTLTVSGGTLAVTGTATGNFAGVVAGLGGLTKSGTATQTLSGTAANTYTGTTIVNAGTLILAKSAGIAAVGGNVSITGGTLRTTANLQTVAAATVSLTGGTFDLAGTQQTVASVSATAAGTIDLAAGTLTVAPTANATISGLISSTGGTGTFVKNGTAVLTLDRAAGNTYAGPTTVNAGTLRLANTSGSATGTGAVTVQTGGKLDGTGRATGAVRLAGGILEAGTGTAGGTLTLAGGLTLDDANTLRVTVSEAGINGVANPSSGLVQLGTGVLARDTAGGTDITSIKLAGTSPLEFNVPYSLTLIQFGSSTNLTIPPHLTIDPNPEGFFFIGTPSLTLTGTALTINFTPTPEPALLLGLAGVTAAAGQAARRRRKVG